MNKFIQLLSLTVLMVGASAHAMDNPNHLGNELCEAVRKGDRGLVQQLLAQGAPVEARDTQGFTPLMNAAIHNHQTICKLLIKHNASVDTADNYGNSPLTLAWIWNYAGMCELLVDEMLRPIKASKNSTVAFLSLQKHPAPACLSLIDKNILKLIAKQIHAHTIEKKQELFTRLNAIGREKLRRQLIQYACKQLENPTTDTPKCAIQ